MAVDTATWMKRLGYAAITAAILSSAVYWQDQQPGPAWKAAEDVSYILVKPSDVHRESLWGDEVSDDLQRRALADLLISPGLLADPYQIYCNEYLYNGQTYSECFKYHYEPYYYYYYYYDNQDYAGPVTFTPKPNDDDDDDNNKKDDDDDDDKNRDDDDDDDDDETETPTPYPYSSSSEVVSYVSSGGPDSDVSSDAGIQPFPPLPPAILGATLLELQRNADQVANLVNMPLALMIVSSGPETLSEFLTSRSTLKDIGSNGGGADLLLFLSDMKRVKAVLLQLDNVMDGLFAGQELGNIGITETQKAILDLQNTDPDVSYLMAAVLGSEKKTNPNLVRFYEMKGSSVSGLQDSKSHRGAISIAAVNDGESGEDIENVRRHLLGKKDDDDDSKAPGELIYGFKKPLSESEYTSLLTGLQDIALEDNLRYSSYSSKKRKQKIEDDVKSLLKDLGFDKKGSSVEESDGGPNSGIYFPSSDFQRKYGKSVAEAGHLHASEVTVSLVSFVKVEEKKDYQRSAVYYVGQMQKGRCFLCDLRDQSSSETDSSEGSSFQSSSAVSSSETNFRDSNRYMCPRTTDISYDYEEYPVTLGQFLFHFPCDQCGWTVSTCPDHQRQWAAYASEQHVLWTFTGSAAVEASKNLGGRTLVNPYRVPNKKVFYQNNGRPASEGDQFEKFTAVVDGAKIVIPLKD